MNHTILLLQRWMYCITRLVKAVATTNKLSLAICVILCLSFSRILPTKQPEKVQRSRNLRRSVMVITRKYQDPAYKPPPHRLLPNASMHKGGGGQGSVQSRDSMYTVLSLHGNFHFYSISSITDISLSHQNVMAVLSTANIYECLYIPSSVIDKICRHCHDVDGQKNQLVQYWRYTSPYASWNLLAGRLRWMKEECALTAAMRFVQKAPGNSIIIISSLWVIIRPYQFSLISQI